MEDDHQVLSRWEVWAAAIDTYTMFLVSAGRRRRTIELRRYQLRHLAEAGLSRSPWTVTTADLVMWLSSHQWAQETRKSYRAALSAFYAWAVETGRMKHNPAAGLPRVRVARTLPRPAPDAVLEHALAAATDRDRLILMLAAYAGLRRGEIAALRWADITDDAIRVAGKGGRLRSVPLHELLGEELQAERRRRAAGEHGTGYRYAGGDLASWVFPGQVHGHMTPGAIGKAAARALGPGWTGHTLRHRFATRALRGSRNLLAVSALLGHSKPETTAIYTQLVAEELAAAVKWV